MSKLQAIIEDYRDDQILMVDGFDNAVIGIEPNSCRLIYSIDKIIEILVSQDMTEEDAIEFFEYNIMGAYLGEMTPIYIKVY